MPSINRLQAAMSVAQEEEEAEEEEEKEEERLEETEERTGWGVARPTPDIECSARFSFLSLLKFSGVKGVQGDVGAPHSQGTPQCTENE